VALRHRTILTRNWKYPRALAVTGRRARALASSGGLQPWKFIGSTDSATQHTNRFSRTIEQYYKDTMEREPNSRHAVQLDVWSDYVCPFCYLAEPAIEQLKKEFPDLIEVRWRAYELRPDPVPTLDPNGEYLQRVWGKAVYPMAAQRGIKLRLPPVQPRSLLAHEAVAFARLHNKDMELHHAIFRAFFEFGEDIGKPDVLVRLALKLGLEEPALRKALAEGGFRDEVLLDEALSQKLEITGVPATLIRPHGDPIETAARVEGAQPYGTFRTKVESCLDNPN
jgi:predicted DsbA family dithiol-disulfide isomerase